MPHDSDLLSDLNDAQRAGVLHEGGPLIVLAGPGTGKTRLITHRVAQLVLHRGVDPATIVAVTFTNKAAAELRERLADLISPAVADSVQAHTFHGFGLRLLRRFPDLSGVGAVPEIIDSAQRRRLLRRLIREHKIYGPLLALGEGALLDDAAAHIGMFRNNGLTPAACAEFSRTWGDRLGAGLGSAGAPIDELEIAAECEHRAMFDAHARLYGLFEGACRERGWLTIDELVTLPAALLRDHERVRAIVRHDHRHFVVDEFQDVNLAQIELIRQLAPPGSHPDLVVVGDDDQAIYEFRGADDRAFARFKALWTDAATLALTENYRSQPPVLEVANAIIGRATERFAPDKRIERAHSLAGEPVPADAGVAIVELAGDAEAGDAIAVLASEEIAGAPEAPLSRIAVIARTHTELDRIAGALDLEDIPYQRRVARGVTDDEGVKDLLAWIELLVDPGAAWAVRRVLVRPPIGAAADQLSAWEREYARSQRLAQAGEAASRGGGVAAARPYTDWLREHAAAESGVARFASLFDDLRGMAQHARASEVVWSIATRAELAHADLLGGRERARRIANLVRVVRFVRSVQHRLDAPGDLAAFWSYYNDLDEKDRGFGEIGEALVETDEDSEGSMANAVQLLTAHGAKGLEFDAVFIPRVNPPHGFPKTAGGDDRVRPPEGLVDRLGDTRDVTQRARAEERRVFYVACTRAQRRLVLLTKRTKSRSKSEHYAQELTLEGPALVSTIDGDTVLTAGRDDLAREAAPAVSRELRRQAAETERRAARAEAAAALAAVESSPDDAGARAEAADRLAGVAERLAVAASFERSGAAPTWASAGAPAALAARLAARAAAIGAEDAAPVRRAMKAPIDLSYTLIENYERCPACFYVSFVLGLGEAPTPELSLGGLVHQAMEVYAKAWQAAEAEGRDPPDLEELLDEGRRRFVAQLRVAGVADGVTIDELLAMLARAHAMMQQNRAEILEVERRITMPYVVDGAGHRMIAKLDRIDRTQEGVRIVDYKTGGASKAKLEPKKDDLQLGIYAMVVRYEMPEVGGQAEYWLLRTGARGIISLDAIDEDKVRARIDKAVRGMTSGEFASKPGRDCRGLCAILGESM